MLRVSQISPCKQAPQAGGCASDLLISWLFWILLTLKLRVSTDIYWILPTYTDSLLDALLTSTDSVLTLYWLCTNPVLTVLFHSQYRVKPCTDSVLTSTIKVKLCTDPVLTFYWLLPMLYWVLLTLQKAWLKLVKMKHLFCFERFLTFCSSVERDDHPNGVFGFFQPPIWQLLQEVLDPSCPSQICVWSNTSSLQQRIILLWNFKQ